MTKVEHFDQPNVVIRARAEVGEGPVFDHRSGRLCWVDITRGTLFESDLATGEQVSTEVGQMLGAAIPRESAEGFAVAVADGFGYLTSGRLEIVDAVLPEPYRRMNDAKCDSHGRLWAGSTDMKYKVGAGALHCWTGEGASRTVAEGFTLPNGIGWNADNTVMYLADSMTRQLLSAPYDADAGVVGEFTQLAAIDEPGLPDGLAVDVDGCIWLAIWGGAAIFRFDSSGKLIGRADMPVDQPSSCAFAPDGTLYITSASAGLTASDLECQPLAGSVFALETATHGVPVRDFAR